MYFRSLYEIFKIVISFELGLGHSTKYNNKKYLNISNISINQNLSDQFVGNLIILHLITELRSYHRIGQRSLDFILKIIWNGLPRDITTVQNQRLLRIPKYNYILYQS